MFIIIEVPYTKYFYFINDLGLMTLYIIHNIQWLDRTSLMLKKKKYLDKSHVAYSSLESFNRHFQTILFYFRSGIIQQVSLTSVALHGVVPPQLVFSPPLLSSVSPLPHVCVSPPPAAAAHALLPLYAAVPLPPSFSGKTRHHTQHKRHLWVYGEIQLVNG